MAALSTPSRTEFVRAATSGRRARAEALLAADPSRPRPVGAARARRGLGRRRERARRPERLGAAALRLLLASSPRVDLARELLARGADPNVTFSNEYGDMPALYGAAGVIHNPELTRVLLEAGANADDGESPYHATEARDPECLRAAARATAATREPIVLAHALDDERPEHVKVLLAAGADAERAAAVRRPPRPRAGDPAAARRARRAARGARRRGLAQAEAAAHRLPARACCAAATTPRRRWPSSAPTRTSTPTTSRSPRSPAASARRRSRPTLDYDQQEVADPVRAARRDGARRRPLRARTSAASSAARRRARCSSTSAGSATPSTRGSWSARAPRSATRSSWCVHGSQYHAIAGRDYVGVAESAAARSSRQRHLEQADGPLAEWLEARAPTVSPNAT